MGDRVLMEYRSLGSCGLRLSAVGLGCNAFGSRADPETSLSIIRHAVAAGITLLDTADLYSGGASEEIVGRALQSLARDDVLLATKGGARVGERPNDGGNSRKHLAESLHRSLRRLGTDFVDIYYVHFPDPDTSIEVTLRFLDDMVRQGKIRYIGVSNFTAWEICQLLWTADRRNLTPVHAVQMSLSLADRTAETEMLPMCRRLGVGAIAYWPLGGGLLTGKYQPGKEPPANSRILTQPIFKKSFTEERLHFAGELRRLAEEVGVSPASLALNWVLNRSGVCQALVGATRVEQLEDSLSAIDQRLDDAVLHQLDKLSEHTRSTPLR